MVTSINQIKFYFIDYRKALAYLTIDMYKKKYDLKPQSQLVVCAFTGGPRADFIKKKILPDTQVHITIFEIR